ncbi:hypothetical protein LEN26_016577 [Aphanomyces euteiches]|nr:hypothetical protein LEN26_016577 [Aphanomyces euteiches]KAH9113288.1 hypothetical protein AeMF1_012492 [Aphanomyces euteiches]KAH9187728.1 hypothetical protein AeNC1_010297 [Aphanomyces euteiches]
MPRPMRQPRVSASWGLSISNASVDNARVSDIVLWLGETALPPPPPSDTSSDRRQEREERWKKRRRMYFMLAGLCAVGLALLAAFVSVRVIRDKAQTTSSSYNGTSSPSPTPTSQDSASPSAPNGSAAAGPPAQAPPQALPRTTATTSPPTASPLPTGSPTVFSPASTPPSTTKTTAPTTTQQTTTPIPSPPVTSTPSNFSLPPLPKATLRFVNKCPDPIELMYTLHNGTLSKTSYQPMAPFDSFDVAGPSYTSGTFRKGRSEQATLLQVSRDNGKLWFDLSVVPPGCSNGHSIEACQAETTKQGYNGPMHVEPQNKSNTSQPQYLCSALHCTDAHCPDAFLFPFDSSDKIRNCDLDESLLVTIC